MPGGGILFMTDRKGKKIAVTRFLWYAVEKGGMTVKQMRWIALLLALVILLTGCSGKSFEELMAEMNAQLITPFSEMEYSRPDIEAMEKALKECCTLADAGADVDGVIEKAWEVYDLYNAFYTQYNLSSIYYFRDMTDTHWEEEYGYCMQNASSVDAMLEEMFYALADCPLKEELEEDPAFGEGFFDGYMGESVWDESLLKMMEQEAALQEQYLELCTLAQEVEYYSEEYFEGYGTKMGQTYVELVALRQDIAEYVGYDDYISFAYDFYHYRDYTPRQAEQYLLEIKEELVPLYRQVEGKGGAIMPDKLYTEKEVFAYAKSSTQAMGGMIAGAFQVMEKAGLYDLSYSDKKFDGSFEVYLTDYYAPFVFVNPTATQYDKLTFVHEFGHFCNDYASYGSVAGVDVAEVFSQGLEYLSLCYGDEAGELEELKMVDCLRIFVEQAAYAYFEYQVYQLEEDELTTENVYALYQQIGTEFGFDVWDWDSRDFVAVSHFYTDPMYIISYVVSNDAALQLYQLEQKEKGSGLELYDKELTTEQTYFLSFLEEAGLESPFAKGRVAQIRKTLEGVLQ